MAAALQVQQRHGLTIEQTVVSYLRSRSLLLVLDNCEHVLDAAARLVAELIRHCPGVAVLATSREPLGLDGEQLRPVDPLPAEEAGTLFVLRARDNQPDFRPGRDEAPAVADICRQLDGLPLAIELAAARIRGMSAAEIARRLDGGRLLSRRRADRAGPPAEPGRDHRLVLPAALGRGAAAVHPAVDVRRRLRPGGGARDLRRPRSRPRTTPSTCSPGWWTSRW